MTPELFGTIRAYPVLLAFAVVVGTGVALYVVRRAGVSTGSYLRAHFLLIAAGLLGSKLDAIVEHHGAFYGFGWEAQNNFRYPGAIIGLTLAFPLAAKWMRSGLGAGRLQNLPADVPALQRLPADVSPPLGTLAFADLLAPAVCFAMATFRIGCFLEGCCFGVPSRLPWALRFPADSHPWADEVAKGLISANALASLPVHPLQLYFLLLALLVGTVLLWLQPRKQFDGQVMLLYLALHEPGKFLLEFLRAQPAPRVQLLSAAFALIAWSILLGRRLVAVRPAPPLAKMASRDACPTGLPHAALRTVASVPAGGDSRGGVNAPDDADFDRAAPARYRQTLGGEVLQVQRDRFARLGDGVLDRAPGGGAAQDVRYGHAVKARVARLLDFDGEPQAARPNRRVSARALRL